MSLRELDNGNSSGLSAPNTYALWGDSNTGDGVVGTSAGDTGVYGRSNLAGSTGDVIVYGGYGVFGVNDQTVGIGVFGQGNGDNGFGVWGTSTSGYGVTGTSTSGFGVEGNSTDGFGVSGNSISSNGVTGHSEDGNGVAGYSNNGYGVYGESFSNNFGVVGKGANAAVFAFNPNNTNAAYLASGCCAAWFTGQVHVAGLLTKTQGMFQIDHPLDPANKYLFHSGVESPEMKNIYDGVVVLDTNGEGVVELPTWFEPLNTEFRYQLTPIGTPGPTLYIAEEISNNRFKIAGGMPSMKVSWQVTGIRHDAWAKAHPMQVEEEKSAEERGHYLHPELHGAAGEKSIERVRHPRQTI